MSDACNVDKRVKTNLRLSIKKTTRPCASYQADGFEEIDAPHDASTPLVKSKPHDAVKLKTDNAIACSNRGIAYRNRGQYQRAIDEYITRLYD